MSKAKKDWADLAAEACWTLIYTQLNITADRTEADVPEAKRVFLIQQMAQIIREAERADAHADLDEFMRSHGHKPKPTQLPRAKKQIKSGSTEDSDEHPGLQP